MGKFSNQFLDIDKKSCQCAAISSVAAYTEL
jgi:hypothetical protein